MEFRGSHVKVMSNLMYIPSLKPTTFLGNNDLYTKVWVLYHTAVHKIKLRNMLHDYSYYHDKKYMMLGIILWT